jgi:drug/metabolite transporter (DMT)-like permease
LPARRPHVLTITAFLFLCLLWAAATLRFDLFPRGAAEMHVSQMIYDSLLLGFLAVLAGVATAIRKYRWPEQKTTAEALLVAVGLFVLPTLLTEFAGAFVTETTRVALFSLTPLFAVVFEPYLGSVATSAPRGGLLAALAAVAGTVLIFPIEIPRSIASFLGFCGIVLCAVLIAAGNCVAVRACQQTGDSTLGFATVSAGAAAICLGALGIAIPHSKPNSLPVDGWAALDLLSLALLFWLMPRMSSARMTTRFVIAPLLANLAGLALLRPHVLWQTWIGLLGIATGSGWLLIAPDELPEGDGALLRLD